MAGIITNQMKATIRYNAQKEDEKKRVEAYKSSKNTTQSTPVSQPQQQAKWYKGAQPTARETGAQVYRVGMQDPSKQSDLNAMFEFELDNPNGPIYQPYRKATTTSYTKTNMQNTLKAQQEWAGLQDELNYWAGRSDLNLSDDEIIGRIDWKKYSTLSKMDEQAALGTPMALVEGIGYSKDAMYGVLWAARNPGQSTGDALYDSIQGQLGRGNQFKANNVNGWRDATSDSYAPYKAGATALYDLAYTYGMDGDFDMDWLNSQQGLVLLNGDEQMRKDYNRIYEVVTQTDKIEEELQRYHAEVNSAIASGMDPSVVFDAGKMAKDYPELWKAYEGQRSGKLTETSRALDFDFNADVLAVQDAYLKKTGTMDDADFADDVAAMLGLPTLNNEAQRAVTRQTNEQLQAAGSIFAKDFTPAESSAMYTASAGYMPTKQQLVQSILNGTAGDNEAYTSAVDAANAYASEFWLNSVNKLKELENHLQAFDEYDALVKEWDEVRNAENVDENARWEYEEKFAALEPQKSVWGSYESRDELVSAIENEKRIQANTLKMFSDAERLNTNGQSSGSVMPLLTFVDAFGGYESVRYPNTEWGKGMSEGSDWATVSKSIAEQEKSNGVMLRMINTALKQAEQYGLGEDYTRGLIAARDDIARENQLMQYDKLHGAQDFDSQVSAFDKSQTAAEPKFFYVRGSANDAEVYRAGIVDMEKALAAYGDDDTRLLYPGQMTDSEKETYKYLFMTQGEEAATGYVEALIPMLDARYRQGVLELADDATSTIAGTIGANALTVLGNLTAVFSLASNAISSLTGEEVDPYSPTFSLSAFSGRVRENTRKAIGEDNPWVVAYDAGMAAADSLTAALAGGGSQFITLALQSGNAANASLMEAKMRGASDQQAWMYAGASAAAEYFTEKGPVADLFDAFANGGTGVFKETLIRGMLAEGFGEGLSEIVNTVSDNVIMQELSQYNASVEQYMAEGYTEEAAKSMAATDVVTNVFYSGMLGAVSAAPTTAASYAAGALNKRTQNKFKSRAEAALSKAQSDGAGKPAQAAAMAAAMEAGGSNPEDADAAASAMAQTDPQATYTLWSVLEHSNEFDAVPAVELGALVPDSQTGNLFAMIKEEGATEENVAQLIETANREKADPEVKAKYDAAIASYEEGSATMGAMLGADLSGIKNAQKNAENASRTLQTARTSLEAARASMKSASTVLQNAQKRFSNDHGDKATAAVIKANDKYQKAKQALESAKQTEETAQKDYDAAKAEMETVKQNTLAEIRQQGVTARDQIMANRQAVQEQQAAEAEAKRQSDNVAAMEADAFVDRFLPNAPENFRDQVRQQYMSYEGETKDVTKSMSEFASQVSRKYGNLKITFTDSHGFFEGARIGTGEIFLDKNATQGDLIKGVLIHELVHVAEQSEYYNELAEAVLDLKYKGNQEQMQADLNAVEAYYSDQIGSMRQDGARKELVAKSLSELMTADAEVLKRFVEEKPSISARIWETLKNFVNRMRGVKDPELEKLRNVERVFEKALFAADNNVGNNEVQFNQKEKSFTEAKYFSRQMDHIDDLKQGGYTVVGKIGSESPLNMVGIPDGTLYFDNSKIASEIEKHSDHLNGNVLKQIPSMLENPIAISQPKVPNTVSVYGEMEHNGTPIVVGVMIAKNNTGTVSIPKIRTVHARADVENQITDESILYLNPNEKETKAWFQARGIDVPLGGNHFGFIRSIDLSSENVNAQFSLPSPDIINRQMAVYRKEQQAQYNSYVENSDETPAGMGQRQFAGKTVQESSAVPESFKTVFTMPENLFYAKDTNREQVERAWQRIQQNGFEAEYNRLLEKEEVYDADDTAEANLMMAMALNPNTSDPAVFMSLALRYNEKGTENAQALQARQLFKKMTPTGAQVWVAGKAEKDLKERRRTHQPEAKMVDDAAQVVADSIKDKQGGDELLRLTSGGDFTIDASNNKWGIPLNEQQKALIDQYDLSDVNRPGLFYNRATVKQRMLEAIIATPNPLEVNGLGLNLIQRLEYMKRGDAVVTNADLNYIGARMAEFIGAGEEAGGRAAELALARAYEAYGNIKPATGWEKFRAQRYTNMLLSAPSVIRNVIGNALQNTMNAAAHGTAVEVDKIISKFTGKRTLDHLTVKERADGWAAFVEETKNTFRDYYVDRANTAPNREKYSTSQRGRVFNNGIQEGMRNLENFLMSVGDRNVWKKAFVNSLAEQQRLADQGLLFNTDGTTMTHEQMVEQAEKDANYATFTEDNAVQELMGALAQKHPRIADVISVYLPFTGVPSNIVKRSLQFSPVGLAYTIGKWGVDKATHKNFDQRSFVDNLSRGLTGTGLMVAGALLAKMGLIKLGTEDEEAQKAYDAATAMGEQYTPYVYDPFTDTYVSMSTFAPALSPLVWGTAVMESLKGDEDVADALLNSLMYSTDSIFDASYLSGFSDIFNSQGSFTENLINAGMSNITSQMVPAMITQMANATDPYVRNTKDKNKIIEMLKITASKIPGLRQTLPEKVDVAGDTVRTKGWWSFIDPFTRTNPSHNEALIEANRLYDLTGDTSVLPSDLLRGRTNTLNVGGGKKLVLENQDKEWYQKRYGEIWTTALMELMNSPKYARMDDDERAEALKKILSDAMSQAKKEAWAKYGEE